MARLQSPATRLRPLLGTMGRHQILEIVLIGVGLSFAAYFFLAWLFLPSWTHFDVLMTSKNFLLKPGESFLRALPEHIFNLRMTEGGFYRPRFMSFLIEYVDMNLARKMYAVFPGLGIKLPSYGVSIIATVAAFAWFWRTLFPGNGLGIALIAGAGLLYCDVYMNTSFMVLRGGKFLNSAAALFCMTLFMRYRVREFQWPTAGPCAAVAGVLFLLMAMDEQVTALIAFIAGVAMVDICLRRRISQAVVMFAIAVSAYASFYLFWGRWLFARYTPDGINETAHYHQFSDVLRVNSTLVSQAAEMLLANLTALGVASLVLLAVHLISLGRIAWKRHERFQRLFIVVAFTLFPLALTSIMVASHYDMYLIKSLWTLFYLALPVHMLIASVVLSSALADYRRNWATIALGAAFLSICVAGAYRLNALHRVSCEETLRVITELPSWPIFACGLNPIFP